MSFEERIDRLTERHEALAQTVELHHAMLSRIEANMQDIQQIQREQAIQNQHHREMLDGILTATDRLIKVVDSHESRLHKLERGA